MICSLIGSFLLVYVAVITFMNILGYPLGEFMIMRKTTHFSLKKIYAISFILQLIAMFVLLEEGHITTLICLLFAIILTFITCKNLQSQCEERRYFMAPLLSIITLCFWFTLFNA
jgi:hypothetical protein